MAEGFRGGLDTSNTPDKQVAYLVGRASCCAAFVAASDELLEPDAGIDEAQLYEPEDPGTSTPEYQMPLPVREPRTATWPPGRVPGTNPEKTFGPMSIPVAFGRRDDGTAKGGCHETETVECVTYF